MGAQGVDEGRELRPTTTQHRRADPAVDAGLEPPPTGDPVGDGCGLIEMGVRSQRLDAPGPGAGAGTSRATSTGALSVSGVAIRLAAARIAASLRQLVDKGRVGTSSRDVPNRRVNAASVVALAPRHP